MFLEKEEEEDIFTIISELYIMDFGISNDITDQRHVRVLHSLPNAHDYPSPRLKQARDFHSKPFDCSQVLKSTVLSLYTARQWRLSSIGMKGISQSTNHVSDGYPNLFSFFILFQPVFTRLPYPISKSTAVLRETTYYK